MAAAPVDVRWSVGWDGTLVVGRWMPASAAVTITEPGEYGLEISAVDSVGHTVSFPSVRSSLSTGPQTLTGLFQVGRLEGPLTARVLKDGAVVSEQQWLLGATQGTVILPPVMKLSDRLFVVVGKPRGLDGLTHFDKDGQPARVVLSTHADATTLPTNAAAYDGVHAVILAGDQRLPEGVRSALLDWVRRGGRLIVSIPKDVAGWSTNPLRTSLPIEIGAEPYVVRELGSLEIFAGRNVRIPVTGRLAVAKLQPRDGQILAGTREEPLLVSAALGFGEVTVLALDLTQAPLANWGALADFNARLLKVSNVAAASSRRSQQIGQLTTTGITDLASQLVAAQDHFPQIRSASPWEVMGWMLLYIALIGPCDYLLVHYVFRRPALTWATVLITAIGFGWVATQAVQSASPAHLQVKQLDVLDVDVEGQLARYRSWVALHSASTSRVDWQFALQGSATPALMTPFAPPEATFGGMYRAPGSEWGRTNYTVDLPSGSLRRTPVLERSTQSWQSSWMEADVKVVDSNLRADGLGRLTGSVQHHFAGPIEEWLLVFGNRVYRLQDDRAAVPNLPWESGVSLQLEDPRIYQRELRSLLTGTVARIERREQGSSPTSGTIRNEVTRYDPQERDPLAIWQMITFHEEAGGSAYTSLANELLHSDDLSRQLDMGRAVLFGKLAAPSRVETQADGQVIKPTEATVIVRLVLPVGRSTEIQQALPKLVK